LKNLWNILESWKITEAQFIFPVFEFLIIYYEKYQRNSRSYESYIFTKAFSFSKISEKIEILFN
jgi:hypothetical protein